MIPFLARKFNFTILAKNPVLRFWRKHFVSRFSQEKLIFGFGWKFAFCGGKIDFVVLTENFDFLGFGQNIRFCGSGGKKNLLF